MSASLVASVTLAALIAMPGVATPQTAAPLITPAWSNVVDQPNFKIDIDTKSVKLIVRHNGFELLSRLKMDFGTPFAISGKTKLGAYYVNEVAAKCNDDTFNIEKSTVYASDGEVLATGTNIASIKNPKNTGSFVTVWLHLACSKFKGKKPPTII